MPFVIGENVGPYRLVEQMGQGGMATVFKAYHPSLDRYVAIKVLHLAFMEDSNFLARFQREAKVVAHLEHPNIVPIYDYAEHENRPYLVMKYIEGETLKQRLEKGPLNCEEILAISDAVGKALAYAHQQDVLHRDVKPSNVMIAKDGTTYLADFGLARMAQMGESSLTTDRLIGTPQYISPEQAIGKPDLDGRTDIYSFGITVYEMCIGQVPYNADTPFAIIHDHIYTPLPLPHTLKPDISEALERVLLKALAKERDERYATVKEFVDALEKAIKGQQVPVRIIIPLEPSLATENNAVHGPQATTESRPSPMSGMPPVTPGNSGVAPASANVLTQPKKEKNKGSKTLVMIASIFAALILLFLCVFLGTRITKNVELEHEQNNTLTPAVMTPELSAKQTVQQSSTEIASTTGDIDSANAALKAAVVAWQNEDFMKIVKEVSQAQREAKGNQDFYSNAYRYLADNNAWLVAALLFFDPDFKPIQDLRSEDQIIIGHEILYKSAIDPLSDKLYASGKQAPLISLAADMRYELYYGDSAQAKERLDILLKSPVDSKRYPESKLLEAEFYKQTGDPERAKALLEKLLGDNSTPEWVKIEALNLKSNINSQ